MYAQTHNPAMQYHNVGVSTGIEDANPAELVYLLFEGAVARLQAARGHIERGDIGRKALMINEASDIVIELQRSLDKDKGGEFAERLDALYDYILMQLVKANIHSDITKIDEAIKLLDPIRDAWKQTSGHH
ncbi:MAG: flagellar export chaperone FliS [Gammaproteobacteria bacterium]